MISISTASSNKSPLPIEDLVEPEFFYRILNWRDDTHRGTGDYRVRFRISASQYFVFEQINYRMLNESMNKLSRAFYILGLITECREYGLFPESINSISKEIGYNTEVNMRNVILDRFNRLNFNNKTTTTVIKKIIARYGNCSLFKLIKDDLKDIMGVTKFHVTPYNNIFLSGIMQVRDYTKNFRIGKDPLTNARFDCTSSADNADVNFRVSEKTHALFCKLQRKIFQYDGMRMSKFNRGIFVKGLYVYARWMVRNNVYIADRLECLRFYRSILDVLYFK